MSTRSRPGEALSVSRARSQHARDACAPRARLSFVHSPPTSCRLACAQMMLVRMHDEVGGGRQPLGGGLLSSPSTTGTGGTIAGVLLGCGCASWRGCLVARRAAGWRRGARRRAEGAGGVGWCWSRRDRSLQCLGRLGGEGGGARRRSGGSRRSRWGALVFTAFARDCVGSSCWAVHGMLDMHARVEMDRGINCTSIALFKTHIKVGGRLLRFRENRVRK